MNVDFLSFQVRNVGGRRPIHPSRPRQEGGALSKRLRRRPTLELLEDRLALSGTFSTLSNAAPENIGTMLLLSDGSVMALGGGGQFPSDQWYKLAPDASGSYVNGTWSTLASMHTPRAFFASNVLPDGRVFVLGGEYSGSRWAMNWTNSGEIYDPVLNNWTNIAPFPQTNFGDDPTQILPDGSVLAGYLSGTNTWVYHPDFDTWTAGGNKLNNDQSDEETWLKLPDNSILTYDIFSNSTAQRFIPASNSWVKTGRVPVALTDDHHEIGPAFLMPDGRAFFLGASGNTAFYATSTNSWQTGPQIPQGYGCDDAPGAEMPNGHILFAAHLLSDPGANTSKVFEFDPSTNQYTDVTPGNPFRQAPLTRMLVLPSGQVLVSPGLSVTLSVYTPTGVPDTSWRPTISGVTANSDGTYTLTGTQLNGISQGASYGDDAEMDSNYPIVRLTDAIGKVSYARTFNWSSTGVATGSSVVTTAFRLPTGIKAGTYSLSVVANGIASTSDYSIALNTTHVDLSGNFNRSGIVADGIPFSGGGIDGHGYAFSANLLGPQLGWNGAVFDIGPAWANNVVSARGQILTLPGGKFSNLMFVGTGVNGSQSGLNFLVKYTDGSSDTFLQDVSDWGTISGFPGESGVKKSPYRDIRDGRREDNQYSVYGYSLRLNSSKTVASLTLPIDLDLELLAIDLTSAAQKVVASPTNVGRVATSVAYNSDAPHTYVFNSSITSNENHPDVLVPDPLPASTLPGPADETDRHVISKRRIPRISWVPDGDSNAR
jgi:Kelch motif